MSDKPTRSEIRKSMLENHDEFRVSLFLFRLFVARHTSHVTRRYFYAQSY